MYTLNDTFNKQKMQYITFALRYVLHMAMVVRCNIRIESRAYHKKKRAAQPVSQPASQGKTKYNPSIRKVHKMKSKEKQNIEIKPINLNFSNECCWCWFLASFILLLFFFFVFSFICFRQCFFFLLMSISCVRSFILCFYAYGRVEILKFIHIGR